MEIFKINKAPVIPDELDDIELYPYYIQDFIKTMGDKFDLSNFYRNIKDIEIRPRSKFESEVRAEYNVSANIIEYNKNELDDHIMHELFHVATRTETRDRVFAGFLQIDNDGYGIGNGLNEGYTSLMDDKYFIDYTKTKRKDANNIYATSKYVCNILNILLGTDTMENYYMNADLLGLFNDLASYSSKKEAYQFIIDMDRLCEQADSKRLPNVKEVLRRYTSIIYYLSECFLTRFKYELRDNQMSKEDYDKCVEFVKYLLDNPISYNKVIRSRKLSKYYKYLDSYTDEKIKSRV